jgi:hypothetical protein
MSDIWNNDYSYAGKGAKARKRLRIEDVNANTMNVKPRKDKRKRYERKPELERKRAKEIETSEAYHNARGVKQRIRYLVLDHDMGYLDMCAQMKREQCPVSGITIGNVRTDMREILKLLEREGLLNVEALAKRRKGGSGERVK